MKRVSTIAAIAFGVGLAVMITPQLSDNAMAVIVGVACGVLASIPTSLLILAISAGSGRQTHRQDYPLVVIDRFGQSHSASPSFPIVMDLETEADHLF